IEICAVASCLLREYNDRETTHCQEIFAKVSPSLQNLTKKLEERDANEPVPYVGSAPMVYCCMARSEFDLRHMDKCVQYIQVGLQLCDGQPDGVWMSGRLNMMLGQALIEMGKFQEAENALQLSLKQLKEVGGEKNAWVAECQYNLGLVYFR